VQWNTLTDPFRTFEKIRSQNIKVGLGLSPDDKLDDACRFFRGIDLLLLLGVYPGFGGQSIQPGTSEKIKSARKIIDQTDNRPLIAIDGGVKLENAADLVHAGADILIMGTALFQSTNMAETVKAVRESIVESQRH
jgi:ribulose-phosphate 3-epimerase